MESDRGYALALDLKRPGWLGDGLVDVDLAALTRSAIGWSL
jgi:hypothetical protein